jgi:transcriptional regulator with XRE-family HTH domain
MTAEELTKINEPIDEYGKIDRILMRMTSLGMERENIQTDLNISKQKFSKWVKKKSAPKTIDIYRISKYLNMSLQELITGEKDRMLSQEERDFLSSFNNLDHKDKGEIIGFIHLKIENAKRAPFYPVRGKTRTTRTVPGLPAGSTWPYLIFRCAVSPNTIRASSKGIGTRLGNGYWTLCVTTRNSAVP